MSYGDAETPNLLSSTRFQAQSIPIALELILVAIDYCKQVFKFSTQDHELNAAERQEYSGIISLRERRRIDDKIELFWADVIDKGLRELQRVGLLDESSGPADVIYPLSQAMAFTLEEMILQRIKLETMNTHFDSFKNDEVKIEYIIGRLRLGPKSRRECALGAALVTYMVSKMEEFIAALVQSGLILFPYALGPLPSVPDAIITRYQAHVSTSDLRRWQIDRKVAELINDGSDVWRRRIDKWAKIDLAQAGTGWDTLAEMVQRRHAIVHNGGRADDDYISKVPDGFKSGVEPGTELVCDSAYMDTISMELETWAICMASHWAKHFFKEEASYYPDIIGRVVKLESLGKWQQGLSILDTLLLDPIPADANLVTLAELNRWYCLQELQPNDKRLNGDILSWKPREIENDLSGAFRVEVGRAALLRNYEELAGLLRRGLGSPDLGFKKSYFREMPLMKRAMQESAVVNALMSGVDPVRIRASSRSRKR